MDVFVVVDDRAVNGYDGTLHTEKYTVGWFELEFLSKIWLMMEETSMDGELENLLCQTEQNSSLSNFIGFGFLYV